MRHPFIVLCLIALLDSAHPAAAEDWSFQGAVDTGSEKLYYLVPEGTKIGFRDHKPEMDIVEYVPEDQSVEQWTDMITVMVFPRPSGFTLDAFFQNMSEGFVEGCEVEALVRDPKRFPDGTYPAGTQAAFCGKTIRFGQGEALIYKAILGAKALYVVQRAWRFPPSDQSRYLPITEDMLVSAIERLETVHLCDSEIASERCPASD